MTSMPPSLDELPKGHQLPPTTFDLSSEWVRAYTAAVEDEAIGALGEGLVPPMAVVALAVRSLLDGAKLPAGAIHLGQEMDFLRPLCVGQRLGVSARIASRGERQGWILIGVDLSVEDEDREPVMQGRALLTMPASPEREA
jgi:acyl dehydratase